MMDMELLQKEYEPLVRYRKRDLLREYLQYEILNLIFAGPYGPRYTFLGGTCCRLVYNSQRFSEDLDFDNDDLTQDDFEATAALVKRGLELLGYEVTLKFTYKGAFHCGVKFPALLYHYGLTGHKEAKLLIKLDTEKQGYTFQPHLAYLNKFGVSMDVRAVPPDLLLAQKFSAVLGRKRPKGRDFYDVRFLLDITDPDYDYLNQKLSINNAKMLHERVVTHIADFDFAQLASDVEPFLFQPEDVELVSRFGADWRAGKLLRLNG